MHCCLLHPACQSIEQSRLASARWSQKQGDAARPQSAAHIIQDAELRLAGFHGTHLLQYALQAATGVAQSGSLQGGCIERAINKWAYLCIKLQLKDSAAWQSLEELAMSVGTEDRLYTKIQQRCA